MKLLTEKRNLPCILNCTQGKDRTGLIVALTLLVLGVSEEDVITNYTLSEKGLEKERPKLLAVEFREFGINEEFCHADPMVMRYGR